MGLYLGSRDFAAAPSSEGGYATNVATAPPIAIQLARALLVAAVVTSGFVLLFGGVGILISAGGRLIISTVPWVALGIGGVLIILGIAMLRGRHLSAGIAARLAARLAARMGDPGTAGVRGFFVFGVAYATASLSCTLPIFLTVVGGSLVVSGFAAAALQFVSYALGM
ncbi:MAG: hypothetical protein HYY66_03750, partial [Candidatus Tectomicrobia bacterium]|nr:hypothetical protein [Candidatus Tectomicrobia bacterium]